MLQLELLGRPPRPPAPPTALPPLQPGRQRGAESGEEEGEEQDRRQQVQVQYSTVQYSTVQYRTVQCKCRMRKIEKIQTLDQQTAKLKAENDELAALAGKLKEQVALSSSLFVDLYITHNFRCTNSNKNYSGM